MTNTTISTGNFFYLKPVRSSRESTSLFLSLVRARVYKFLVMIRDNLLMASMSENHFVKEDNNMCYLLLLGLELPLPILRDYSNRYWNWMYCWSWFIKFHADNLTLFHLTNTTDVETYYYEISGQACAYILN